MHPLAIRRGKAYLVDCVGYAGIAAATVPLGLVTAAAGWGERRGFVIALSAIPPVLATLLAARRESQAGATAGKRRYELVVKDAHGGTVGWGRSLLRNAVKIGIPWQLGHVVAIGAVFGGFEEGDLLTISAAVLTYPLLGAAVITVMVGRGLGIHDRVARTHVVER